MTDSVQRVQSLQETTVDASEKHDAAVATAVQQAKVGAR